MTNTTRPVRAPLARRLGLEDTTRPVRAPLARRLSLEDLNSALSGLPHDQWLAWTLVHADHFDVATAAAIEGVHADLMAGHLDSATATLRRRLGAAYNVKRIVLAHESYIRNLDV